MLRSGIKGMLRWVSTQDLRYLYAAFTSIERVSETEASLYLVRGDTPNALAGKRDGRGVVFVNFAMFDLVGDDINLWAALFGHEIAHLKLAHGRKYCAVQYRFKPA